jgi:drug/metabolite transporter (DMT)-like permease
MVILSYPLFMGTAMLYAPASHAGIVLAVQPLITALAGMAIGGERPSAGFWVCSLAGTAAVATYAIWSAAGSAQLHWADLLLAGAAITGSYGYALGGQLTRQMPGWQVISWTVVICAPPLALLLLAIGTPINWQASAPAWGAFLYVGVFSMYLGFFAWNKGLALGGIAIVGQMQLVQPFIVLLGSSLLLGERIGPLELGFAALVVTIVMVGSRTRVGRTT